MKRVVQALIIAALGVIGFALSAYALDPPHNFSTNQITCSDGPEGSGISGCHKPHNAAGGAITKIGGNFNLCYSCHNTAGDANAKPFADSDQALPAPGLPSGVSATGTSHRWDSGAAGHLEAVGTPSSTGTVQSTGTFNGRYPKTYTITTTGTAGQPTTTFSWNCRRWPTDTDACGSGTGNTTGTVLLNEGVSVAFSGSFVAADQWRIFVRTDISHPISAALRTADGKIMCSSCHNQHSQAAQPFDPSAPAYGGSGTGAGRHFQRLNNNANEMCLDCHTARNKGSLSGQTGNMTHPVGLARSIWNGLFKARASITLPLDKGADIVPGNDDDRIQCLSCHQPHYAPTSDGSLARMTNITSLCTDCHTLADPGTASHLNTSTGVLWPSGQYGSNFPAITDATKRGACINCHQPHGWPDDVTPSQDYPSLLVEAKGDICFTCHDSDGPASKDIYSQFNPTPISSDVCADTSTTCDQVHDASLCASCHNPHKVSGSSKIQNPKDWSDGTTNFLAGEAYTKTYGTANIYRWWDGGAWQNLVYRETTGDANPTFSGGVTWTVGAAAPQGSYTDTASSAGSSYTPQGDEGALTQIVYTVTVSTGGNPGPPTATYSIGAATCTDVTNSPPCLDDTATSGGTYNDQGDPGNNTYTVSVATAGQTGTATLAISSTREGSLPNQTWNSGSPIPLSPRGVTITITDPDSRTRDRTLVTGQRWQIVVTQVPAGQARITVTSTNNLDNSGPTVVTAFGSPVNVGTRGVKITFTDGGDGVLTQGNTWSIPVNKTTTPVPPDYVAFCLTCHDGSPPAGVVMPPGMLNMASVYLGSDKGAPAPAAGDFHGSANGNNASQGVLKAIWNANYPGEHSPKYAALQCTICHDQHGTPNIYHLKTQIVVNGQAQANYKVAAGTDYILPCLNSTGSTVLPCGDPGASQRLRHWDAFCSSCHDHTGHNYGPGNETTTCNQGHVHGGGNF